MFLQYIPIGPIYYWGLGSVEQVFGVALVEQEAMVEIEKVVEEKEWEDSCTRASTPDEVHSTEAVAEHKNKTNEQLEEHGIDMDMRRRGCGPGRMSRGTARSHGSGLIRVVIGLGCPLHSLLVRFGSMWPPLVHKIEWFSGSFMLLGKLVSIQSC